MESERTQILRFVKEFGLALALLIGIVSLLCIVSRNSDAYGSANILKLNRLVSAEHPRVIFIGGSGLAFGLNSTVIEHQTHLHPVNLGVYAGFGIEYLIEQARAGIQPGDTVVLVPEYDILTNSPSANGFLVLEAAQASPQTLRFALTNTRSIAAIVRAFPTWISTRAVSLAGRIIAPVIPHADTLYYRVYRASAFNVYGDNDGAKKETYRLPPTEIGTSTAGVLQTPLNDETLNVIEQFIREEEARGVRVYISWPAIPRTLAHIAADRLELSDREIAKRFSGHVLGEQRDFIFDDWDFFDTVNHLDPEARDVRSKKMADLLTQVTH